MVGVGFCADDCGWFLRILHLTSTYVSNSLLNFRVVVDLCVNGATGHLYKIKL